MKEFAENGNRMKKIAGGIKNKKDGLNNPSFSH
jgi:hypothetical protein